MFKSLLLLLFISVVANAEIQKITDAVVKDLDGNDVAFTKYAGKCILVVNTASGCTFTKVNMKYFNELQKRHPNLAIVAFPSNTFNQEPKTESELKNWFKEWNAEYDVFAKLDVHNSEIYKFLTKQAGDKAVIWNYGKYVVEKDGTTVERYGPQAGAILSNGLDEHLSRCV